MANTHDHSAIDEREQSGNVNNMDFLAKERSRLGDEKDSLSLLLVHKKDELKDLQRKPQVRAPLGIPGNPLTKYTCDNCHHKGHRSMMNKGQKSCPYLACEGYNECGIEGKHPEHRKVVADVVKEIANLERRLKNIDDELNSIKAFQEHNSTNFITVVRPTLKASFPQKYVGKDGNQHLQRDLRYMKVACSGKIPNDLSSQNISALLIKGKSKVSSVVDSGVSSVTTDTKSVSDDNVLSVPSKSMLDGSGAVNYQLTTLGTPYTGTLPKCISTPFQYMQPWVYSSPPFDLYRTSYMYQPNTSSPSASSASQSSTQAAVYPPLPEEAPPALPPLPDSEFDQ